MNASCLWGFQSPPNHLGAAPMALPCTEPVAPVGFQDCYLSSVYSEQSVPA